MTEDARQEPGTGYDGQPQLLEQFDLVELEPMLRHLPAHMRLSSTEVNATSLFVGGRPWNSPRWVPRKPILAATVSSPHPISSIVSRRSGNAPAKTSKMNSTQASASKGPGAPGACAT